MRKIWQFYGRQSIDEVKSAWASVGVEFGKNDMYNRTYQACFYRIDGKYVSQYEAWIHAEQVVGKHLKRADWDW